MSTFVKTRPLAALLALGLFTAGCQSSLDRIEDWEETQPTTPATDIREAVAPEGFDFATAFESELAISAVRPNSNTTVANVALSLWTTNEKAEPVKLAYGVTDASGNWRPQVAVPVDRDSLTLLVESLSYPTEHRIAVAPSTLTRYVLGGTNTTGRIVPEVMPPDEGDTLAVASGGLSSRAAMSYLGGFDANGVPDYLTTPGNIYPDVLDFISTNLPETPGVPQQNPHYLDPEFQGSVYFKEDGELWVSFAHEGAGYRNTLGYFTFDPNNPPSKKKRIDPHTVVFPNVSFTGSGGGLAVGDRVYLGKFDAGTAVGWFLIPNGWDSRRRRVRDRSNTRYSLDYLNTFTSDPYRKHAVLLANNFREFLVLGFEDLNRPGGDNDFNDAVFVVQPDPWSAVDISKTPEVILPGQDEDGDGVYSDQDLYPNDPERAFEIHTPAEGEHGTLAYEDMWPRIGDYDFNDLVVDFNFVEVLNANREIKDVKMDIRVRAIGASQNHAFAINLPVDPSVVEAVRGQVLGNNDFIDLESNGTERGMSTSVVPVFTDGFALFNERFGIINTDPTKPEIAPGVVNIEMTFRVPQQREVLGLPPYDPFMIRSRDRSREIHLAGKAPTAKADMSTFNTEADQSDAASGYWYVDKNNLPWALCLSAEMKYPQEKVRIDEVYPNFIDFATYGGNSARGWFRNTPGNVNASRGY